MCQTLYCDVIFPGLEIYKDFKKVIEKVEQKVCSNENYKSTLRRTALREKQVPVSTHPSAALVHCVTIMSTKVLRYVLGLKKELISQSLSGTRLTSFSTKPALPILTLYTKVSYQT